MKLIDKPWKRAVLWVIVLNEIRGLLTVALVLWYGKGLMP